MCWVGEQVPGARRAPSHTLTYPPHTHPRHTHSPTPLPHEQPNPNSIIQNDEARGTNHLDFFKFVGRVVGKVRKGGRSALVVCTWVRREWVGRWLGVVD